jgi:hypothetical protein
MKLIPLVDAKLHYSRIHLAAVVTDSIVHLLVILFNNASSTAYFYTALNGSIF